jgi:hypothetical protein
LNRKPGGEILPHGLWQSEDSTARSSHPAGVATAPRAGSTPFSPVNSGPNYSPLMFRCKALLPNWLRPEMPNYSPLPQVSGPNGELFGRFWRDDDDASSSGSMTSAIVQDAQRSELFTADPAGPVNNSLEQTKLVATRGSHSYRQVKIPRSNTQFAPPTKRLGHCLADNSCRRPLSAGQSP